MMSSVVMTSSRSSDLDVDFVERLLIKLRKSSLSTASIAPKPYYTAGSVLAEARKTSGS